MSQAPRTVDAAFSFCHDLARSYIPPPTRQNDADFSRRLPSLRQIGYKSKVWLIERSISVDSPGDVHTRLIKYNSPFWPEALLIVKT